MTRVYLHCADCLGTGMSKGGIPALGVPPQPCPECHGAGGGRFVLVPRPIPEKIDGQKVTAYALVEEPK